MKLGIIREGKIPYDKRVPFTPLQCVEIKQRFGVEVQVQSSAHRAYTDEEYSEVGITVTDNIDNCDVLFGVKEVPIMELIPNKVYFFFSHTTKKQPHNRELLKQILLKNIKLIDYECLRFPSGERVLGFGRFAGIVGAYNGLDAYGRRNNLFELKPAYQCFDYNELKENLKKIRLQNVKILVTGEGRVSSGITEILDFCGFQKVSKQEYIAHQNSNPVYLQLNYDEYYRFKDSKVFDKEKYLADPSLVESNLGDLWQHTDILMTGHFWDHRSAALFKIEDAQRPEFKTKVIADITCDINGSVPLTIRPAKIGDPVYGINPLNMVETDAFAPESITIMAVDNLPCELPRDSSFHFGQDLLEKVLPSFFISDDNKIIEGATITENGALTDRYQYLSDFVSL